MQTPDTVASRTPPRARFSRYKWKRRKSKTYHSESSQRDRGAGRVQTQARSVTGTAPPGLRTDTERDRHPRGLRAAPRPAQRQSWLPPRAGVHVPGHPETPDSLCTRRHTEGCPPASLTHAGSPRISHSTLGGRPLLSRKGVLEMGLPCRSRFETRSSWNIVSRFPAHAWADQRRVRVPAAAPSPQSLALFL